MKTPLVLDKLDSHGDVFIENIKAALHQKIRDIMEVLFSRSRYFLPRVQKYLFSEPRLIVQLEFHKSWLYK